MPRLIQQVGEEYSLEVSGMLANTELGAIPTPAQKETAGPAKQAEAVSAEDDLERRLAQLKGL